MASKNSVQTGFTAGSSNRPEIPLFKSRTVWKTRKKAGTSTKMGFSGKIGPKLVKPDSKSVFIYEKQYTGLENFRLDLFSLIFGIFPISEKSENRLKIHKIYEN